MTTEARTPSNEERIAAILEAHKAVLEREREQHRGGTYKEIDGKFVTGLPIPNNVNPTDLMNQIKREKSEEMTQDYLIGRGFEFVQTATELMDKYGKAEIMPYDGGDGRLKRGLKRTLPPVRFDFDGGLGALLLAEGLREDGTSMGFTLEANLPGEYDEIRIASAGGSEVPVINYRYQLAMAKQADLVIGTLNYMKQQLETQPPAAA